jgi:hypothetical protein
MMERSSLYIVKSYVILVWQHVAVTTILMKHFFVHSVSIKVIDPADSAILGMINVTKLQGKSITLYLCSHQI